MVTGVVRRAVLLGSGKALALVGGAATASDEPCYGALVRGAATAIAVLRQSVLETYGPCSAASPKDVLCCSTARRALLQDVLCGSAARRALRSAARRALPWLCSSAARRACLVQANTCTPQLKNRKQLTTN